MSDERQMSTSDLLTDDRSTVAEPATRDEVPEGMRATADEGTTPLLPEDETADLRSRWDSIQGGFVDDPRKVVKEADSLVAETMKRLAEVFSEERTNLESQWDRGDEVDTEDLRVAVQRYRSFFNRLLAV
jgi:hypothetical protein